MTQRERQIGIGLGVTVVALLLYELVFSPYFDKRAAITNGLRDAQSQREELQSLFDRRLKLEKVWKDMQVGGLKSDPSEAQSQMNAAVLTWASQAGVNVTALKPDRSATQNKFQIIGVRYTLNGSTPAITRLVWALETATIPVRLNEMQITSKEGTDDLTVQMAVSTICQLATANVPAVRTEVSMADTEGAAR